MRQYTREESLLMALASSGFDADLFEAQSILDYLENEGWQVVRVDE